MPRKPFVFIGSSSEGVKFAEAIQMNLNAVAECQIWNQGVFTLGQGILETLTKELHKYDFAILVLTGDDLTISRNTELQSPRDNVIFELGLFIGGLGRHRVYVVENTTTRLKLPSDLAGIVCATFEMPERATLQAALGAASTRIANQIAIHGLRPDVELATGYEKDLKLVTSLIKDKGFKMMSFEGIRKYYSKFDDKYFLDLIEEYPDKIRKCLLSGSRPGIGLL